MNIFGLEIKASGHNGHYVKPHECHQSRQDHSAIFNQRINDMEKSINKRLDDIIFLLKK